MHTEIGVGYPSLPKRNPDQDLAETRVAPGSAGHCVPRSGLFRIGSRRGLAESGKWLREIDSGRSRALRDRVSSRIASRKLRAKAEIVRSAHMTRLW